VGASPQTEVIVRPLVESDLPEAARIIRLAFCTFLGFAPDDPRWPADLDASSGRWRADPSSVLAAEFDGKLVGSNFAARWGSFGFFGPLTVDPGFWNRGVAQQLLGPTMEIFSGWGMRHLGLFTFAQSPKHISLYQKFGFWPRDLVAVMTKQVISASPAPAAGSSLFSEAKSNDKPQLLATCRELTGALFDGLDLEREILAVAEQNLGDTVLLHDGSRLAAFAIYNAGPGTEAGSGVCYVKFAAVHPGAYAGRDFLRLLEAIEPYAHKAGAKKIIAGVNLARREAFHQMIALGFRIELQGVAMETGVASSGYNRAGVYILDDWR